MFPNLSHMFLNRSSIKIKISDFYCQECVKVETATDKLDHGIRYIFLFFLPSTLTIFPTLYIYILLIRRAHNYIPSSSLNTQTTPIV